jgi:hypothetical protein
MSLPKLNDSPKYELTIPSTGKTIRYRPYVVKEEKVLMLAFESGDKKATIQAIMDTISACLDDKPTVNVENLAMFDIEYIFAQIRSKSAGESAKIYVKCDQLVKDDEDEAVVCEHKNELKVDIDEVAIKVPRSKNVIKITDNISIKMQYPTFFMLLDESLDIDTMDDYDDALKLIKMCMVSVNTEDERTLIKDVEDGELTEFVESFTESQFKRVIDFFKTIPKMEKELEFRCAKCGQDNKVKLSGMNDFF